MDVGFLYDKSRRDSYRVEGHNQRYIVQFRLHLKEMLLVIFEKYPAFTAYKTMTNIS
jgi:hypothetical protein